MTTLPKLSYLNPTDYPLITLWTMESYCKAKLAHDELQPEPSEEDNVMFWFLQNEDGSTVHCTTIAHMRFASKLLWSTMLHKYTTLAPTWMKLTPVQQMEFYLDIEDKFPFLQLCEDHYKARKIGTIDYTHWYKNHIVKAKAGKKHCRADPNSEDASNKHTRRMPSLPRRTSHQIHRLESRTRSQTSGKSLVLGPSRPSTPLPSPPPSHPDLSLSPMSTPHALTQGISPSSLDTLTGSPNTIVTDKSDEPPIPSINKPITSSSGLDKTLSSLLGVTLTVGCLLGRLVSFFPSLHFI